MISAVVHRTLSAIFAVVLFVAALLPRPTTRRLYWGPDPIINNKYWSGAMRDAGWKSTTLVSTIYTEINRRADFDETFSDLIPGWVPERIGRSLAPYVAALHLIRRAAVVHIPFSGGPLGSTPLWRLEPHLLRRAGVKVVVLPYGSDFYRYSKVLDTSLRHGLLRSYPQAARREEDIDRRVRMWTRHADIVIPGFQFDGIGRWDVLVFNPLVIDTGVWTPSARSRRNGAPIKVLHTPNHRGFKGTEFLIEAIDDLRRSGVNVELVMLEGVQNEVVRDLMQECDILVEQLIATAYAMSAMEGMASGLAVMANLENDVYTRPARRWAYLNECPIVSTTPETVRDDLERLIEDHQLREQLGVAGRRYVEKYHSYETAQYLFGSIYRVLLDGADVDLMALFDPRTSEYIQRRPPVEHPLVENRLPT